MQEQVARLVYRLILKCVVRTRNSSLQYKSSFKQTEFLKLDLGVTCKGQFTIGDMLRGRESGQASL